MNIVAIRCGWIFIFLWGFKCGGSSALRGRALAVQIVHVVVFHHVIDGSLTASGKGIFANANTNWILNPLYCQYCGLRCIQLCSGSRPPQRRAWWRVLRADHRMTLVDRKEPLWEGAWRRTCPESSCRRTDRSWPLDMRSLWFHQSIAVSWSILKRCS